MTTKEFLEIENQNLKAIIKEYQQGLKNIKQDIHNLDAAIKALSKDIQL